MKVRRRTSRFDLRTRTPVSYNSWQFRPRRFPPFRLPLRRSAPLSSSASVTCWLGQLQAGNVAVAQALWERYFPQLVDLARARLRGRSRGIADEEDVALAAFDSFCRGAQQGRFPRLGDRDDLWSLLVTITARKAARQVRDERRQNRSSPLRSPKGTSTFSTGWTIPACARWR